MRQEHVHSIVQNGVAKAILFVDFYSLQDDFFYQTLYIREKKKGGGS